MSGIIFASSSPHLTFSVSTPYLPFTPPRYLFPISKREARAAATLPHLVVVGNIAAALSASRTQRPPVAGMQPHKTHLYFISPHVLSVVILVTEWISCVKKGSEKEGSSMVFGSGNKFRIRRYLLLTDLTPGVKVSGFNYAFWLIKHLTHAPKHHYLYSNKFF